MTLDRFLKAATIAAVTSGYIEDYARTFPQLSADCG